jgi:MoaA/NifB/PqqE/SkfB family radical SAM enzyme
MNLKKIIHRNSKLVDSFQLLGDFSFQPFFLLVHLTLNCNCSCQNCYQKDGFYQSRNGIITPPEFEKILGDVKKNFWIKPLIHFFGGEPLLNPYFREILKIAEKYNFKCSLTTNGTMLQNNLDEIAKSEKLNQINISLDDIGEKHDRLRGFPGLFNKTISAIKKIREMEAELRIRKRKIINVNCVISLENYGHLFDIATYYLENNIGIDMLVFQHQYSEESVGFDMEILKDQIKRIKEIKSSFEVAIIPNITVELLDKFYNHEGGVSGKCPIPWIGLNILPNFEVTPGGGVLGCNYVIGNLEEESIKEIWNGNKMKEFRNRLRTQGVFPSCIKCCHCRLNLK